MSDEIFTLPKESSKANQRKAIRYSSDERKATVTLKHLLRTNQHIHIKIINISSNGARFSSRYKFSKNARIILNLSIEGGGTWQAPAKVVRKYKNTEYGIVFDALQHNMIDEILVHSEDFTIG